MPVRGPSPGTQHGKGRQKKGRQLRRAAAWEAAVGAAGTATFLGERQTWIGRRRAKAIAQAAVGPLHHDHRLAHARARPRRPGYRDLRPDFYTSRVGRDDKICDDVHGLHRPSA